MINAANDLSIVNPADKDNVETLMRAVETRAVAEVQAAYVIAKKFPRDRYSAYERIINDCKRASLAEKALYAYPRAGTRVEGPSIRLAEAMAQSWGNIDCGVREVSQQDGYSIAEAYAIDLETNARITKTFHVAHFRDTKAKGKVKLTDSRDIYEMVANQGARRLRACILAIIPGDIIEDAVDQCKKTLSSGNMPASEQTKRLVMAFDGLGVKVNHIEKMLGHSLDSIFPDELVTLRSIYQSLKDGMAKPGDFFEIYEKMTNKDDTKMKLDSLLGKNDPLAEVKAMLQITDDVEEGKTTEQSS